MNVDFGQSLQPLFESATDDPAAIDTVHDHWRIILDGDLDRLDDFYAFYSDAISAALQQPEKPSLIDRLKSLGRPAAKTATLQTYQFMSAFPSAAYLRRPNAQEAAHFRLLERHANHLEQIRTAIARPDAKLVERPLPGQTGRWGDIVTGMFALYGKHLAFGQQADRLRSEAALFVPAFYRAFPEQQQADPVKLLEDHPDGVAELAELIRFQLLQRNDACGGPMPKIFDGMLGRRVERDDYLHRNGVKILSLVMTDTGSWTKEQRRSFIDTCVLMPLQLEPVEQAEKLLQQQAAIRVTRDILSKPFVGNGIFSADMQRSSRESQLQRQETERELIQSDFPAWQAQRYEAAVSHVAASPTTLAILKCISGLLPPDEAATLSALHDAAAVRRAGRKKLFPIPADTDNQFRDFGLKLLVIDELMYQQEVLLPKFDVRLFAREYDEREISVEDDGYEVISEVETYFRNLPIAADLLEKVETLSQKSWGSPTIYQIQPFWDPGCGDEVVKIGPEAMTDLALLPNLRRINGLENSRPGADLLAAISARDIQLRDENHG